MFTSKNEEGKVVGITNTAKMIIAIFGVVAMIFGAYTYMKNDMTAIAQGISKDVSLESEKKTAQTLQEVDETHTMRQEVLSIRIEDLKREGAEKEKQYDRDELVRLGTDKFLLSKQLAKEPDNDLLKDKIERIINKIEKLENKLYD